MKVNINLMKQRMVMTATSTLKDDRVRSWIKCIYVVLILKDNKTALSVDKSSGPLLEILRSNILPATEFLKENRLGSLQWKNLFTAALTKKDFSKLDKQFTAVWDIMREKSSSYSTSPNLTNLYTSIVKDFRAYIKGDSEGAYVRLEKNAKETNEHEIYSRFIPAEQDVSSQVKTLRKLIRKYEPDNETYTLDLTVADRLHRDDDATYKQYLKLRLDIKKAYNAEVMTFVRQSGKKLVNIDSLKKHMKSIGMPNLLQDGFVGQIDENGAYYTIKGSKSIGRQLKTIPGGPCYMNTAYDPDKDNTYVLKSKTPGAKNESLFYTIDFGATSQSDKYEKVLENIPYFEDARKKWIKDIINGMGEKKLYAILCEVVYLSTARIGSKDINISQKGDNEGKPTYGIRTLLCKHAKVEANRIYLTYVGVKTSARLRHYIYRDSPEGKAIYDYIVKRKDSAGPNDPIFVNMGRMASPTKLNAYVKSLGLTITIHKFRTIRGTEYFRKYVEGNRTLSAKTTSDPKKVIDEVNKALEAVGKELGHYSTTPDGKKITGATALQYYIVPTEVTSIFDRLGVRMPPAIKKVADVAMRGSQDED